MANDSSSIAFFAAEVLEKTAQRHPRKTAIITKDEELMFAELNQRIHGLAASLQQAGIRQGDRVGVLLPNCAAIPLSYFATQKIGAVTGIFDARLKGKWLQGVLRDAVVNLFIVHQQRRAEAEEVFKELGRIPLWMVAGEGDESFEKRFAVSTAPASLPQLQADDDALILYTS